MMRAVVRSPLTDPSFLISIRSFARRLPFTVPNTTTSRAMMSAVTFAVAPTVSFRSSSWISPSTEPSISRSSLPEISPFTCRLDPSRAVARSAVAPNGRIASVLIAVVPSQVAGASFGGSFEYKFLGSGCAACGVSGFLLPHIGPPQGKAPPHTDFRPGYSKLYSPVLMAANLVCAGRSSQLLGLGTGPAWRGYQCSLNLVQRPTAAARGAAENHAVGPLHDFLQRPVRPLLAFAQDLSYIDIPAKPDLYRGLVTDWNGQHIQDLRPSIQGNKVCCTPAGNLYGVALSLGEVRCGVTRNRIRRKPRNRSQEIYTRISRRS